MTEHTPTPWQSVETRDSFEVQDKYGTVIAEVYQIGEDFDGGPWPHAEANRNLILAAPDLLAALEEAHEALRKTRGYFTGTAAARIVRAIAKARGQ